MLLLIPLLAAVLLLVAACGGGSEAGDQTGSPETSGTDTDEESGSQTSGATAGPEGASQMSLPDAVGQMFVVGMGGTEPDYYIEKMVRERNIGGVMLFANNMESLEQTRGTVSALQELSLGTGPAVPMLVSVDHEGGLVSHAPWVEEEPSPAEVGAGGDPEVARQISERIGTQLIEAGVNTDLAPVVDTGFGAAVGERAYGEDPQLVSEMGAASVRGFEAAGVISSAKHFPNHGPAETDSHVGEPVIDHDLQTIQNFDLPPFRSAIEAGVPMVMVSHLTYPAIDPERPATVSPEAYRLLREDLGFEGVAITDDLNMDGVKRGGTVAEAAVESAAAGADLLIVGATPEEQAAAYDAVVEAVESGEIPEEQVRASVERVLQMKESYGLYEE